MKIYKDELSNRLIEVIVTEEEYDKASFVFSKLHQLYNYSFKEIPYKNRGFTFRTFAESDYDFQNFEKHFNGILNNYSV